MRLAGPDSTPLLSNEPNSVDRRVTRRHFLGLCTAVVGTLATSSAMSAIARIPERKLTLVNLHTGERLKKVTYWAKGDYVDESLSEIDSLLRDHRTDEIHRMDPTLLDLLYSLQVKMDDRQGFHIISGYRSAKTNEMLRKNSSGVAKRSLHTLGRAIDIRLPGRELSDLHQAAKSLKAGGVGLYTKSDFVHVDTGAVRYWHPPG